MEKKDCKKCKDLPEGEVVKGHDHRKCECYNDEYHLCPKHKLSTRHLIRVAEGKKEGE